jgi:hypothetical protein
LAKKLVDDTVNFKYVLRIFDRAGKGRRMPYAEGRTYYDAANEVL